MLQHCILNKLYTFFFKLFKSYFQLVKLISFIFAYNKYRFKIRFSLNHINDWSLANKERPPGKVFADGLGLISGLSKYLITPVLK